MDLQRSFFKKLTVMSATYPECDMEFSRKYALLRHKRNRHGATQPYPQSSDAYPPSSQANPPPPPPLTPPTTTITAWWTPNIQIEGFS